MMRVSFVLAALVLLSVTTVNLASANPCTYTIHASVDSVTVYRDRAVVRRLGSFKTEENNNNVADDDEEDVTVCFRNVTLFQTGYFNRTAGVRVLNSGIVGTGKLELGGVLIKQMNKLDADVIQNTSTMLNAKRNELQEQMSDIRDEHDTARKALDYLEQYMSSVIGQTQKDGEKKFVPSVTEEYFVSRKQSAQRLKALSRSLEKLQQQINEIGNQLHSLQETETVVVANLKLRGQVRKAELTLEYVVRGASWEPHYVLRVNPVKSTVVIQYMASIRQIGESWENVKIDLSTAAPSSGASPPTLGPWELKEQLYVKHEQPQYMDAPIATFVNKKQARRYQQDFEQLVQRMADEGEPPEDPTMATPNAEVSQQSVSSTTAFTLPGRHTILSGEESRLGISAITLEATLNYTTVPRLRPVTYVQAIMKNTSPLIFLPGPVQVYDETSLVSTTTLGLVLPQERFWVYLGPDDGVVVQHTLVRRKQNTVNSGGIFSSDLKSEWHFKYVITAHNRKQTTVQLLIQDHIPTAVKEDVSVTLTNPQGLKPGAAIPNVSLSTTGILEISKVLAPGEKFVFPIEFTVGHPEKMKLEL